MKQEKFKKVVEWENAENIYAPMIIYGTFLLGFIFGWIHNWFINILITFMILVYWFAKGFSEVKRKVYWVKIR